MSENEQQPRVDGGPHGTQRKTWFRANRSGPGWHPSSWQGWLILAVVIAAIVVVVVLSRNGVL